MADARIVKAHDRAVGRALAWFEKNAAETRVQNQGTGRMVRAGDQKTMVATFRHVLLRRQCGRGTRGLRDAGLSCSVHEVLGAG